MPSYEHFFSINDTRILVFEQTQSIDELYQQLDFVDSNEFSKFVSDKRKREFLGVRVALKKLLGIEKTIQYNDDGKPCLSDNSYQISISHSGRWIAVMADPIRSVGIDIEIPTLKIHKIYKRFLHETEQTELSNGENVNQLLLAWSGKEALYKIIGKEAVDFANQLHIFSFEVKKEGTFNAEHLPKKQKISFELFSK